VKGRQRRDQVNLGVSVRSTPGRPAAVDRRPPSVAVFRPGGRNANRQPVTFKDGNVVLGTVSVREPRRRLHDHLLLPQAPRITPSAVYSVTRPSRTASRPQPIR